MCRRTFTLLCALGLIAQPIMAQSKAVPKPAEEVKREEQGLKDPQLESAFRGGLDGVKIESSKDDKAASVLLSHAELWHVKLSGPIDKSSEQASLANLHGLTGSAKVEAGLRYDLQKWH